MFIKRIVPFQKGQLVAFSETKRFRIFLLVYKLEGEGKNIAWKYVQFGNLILLKKKKKKHTGKVFRSKESEDFVRIV